MESWVEVNGNKLYKVSDMGNIFSVNANRIIKKQVNKYGYEYVDMYLSGVKSRRNVHKLVIEAFIGIQDGQVDHIDGDKRNNRLSNLRYCSGWQNKINHLTKDKKIEGKYSSKHVGVFFRKNRNRWIASATVEGKRTLIGSFKHELDAKESYDKFLSSKMVI